MKRWSKVESTIEQRLAQIAENAWGSSIRRVGEFELGATLTKPLHLLRILPYDLRLLFWSLFIWALGYGVYSYVWSLFLRSLSASFTDIGLVFAIGFVSIAITMIPGGILANKYELKSLLIIGWVLSIPAPLILYFSSTWTDSIPSIILLQVSGFNLPALNAYIVGAGEKSKTSSNFGTIYSSVPLGLIFGPAIGGLLLTIVPIREIFLLSFALFTLSTVVLFFISQQPPIKTAHSVYTIHLPRSRVELLLLAVLTGAAVAFSMSSTFLPLFFNQTLSLSPVIVQWLASVQYTGAFVFEVLMGRRADIRSRGGTMALGLTICALGLVGFAMTKNIFFAVPLIFLFGGARSASIIAYSVISAVGKGATRAGQYGFYLTIEQLGFVAGSYLGGVVFGIDSSLVLVISSLLFVTFALVSSLTRFVVTDSVEAETRSFEARETVVSTT
ncbi:MAG TPA: MFS transporter [Candidatus Bathyarchaeia archaeon]|nr:MFS transporter [Candidatus Bathyarchaeia archaeon]